MSSDFEKRFAQVEAEIEEERKRKLDEIIRESMQVLSPDYVPDSQPIEPALDPRTERVLNKLTDLALAGAASFASRSRYALPDDAELERIIEGARARLLKHMNAGTEVATGVELAELAARCGIDATIEVLGLPPRLKH